MLSQYEQRQLHQIEQQLESSDPGLGRSIAGGVNRCTTRSKAGPAHTSRAATWLRALLDMLAVALIVLGALTMNFLLIFAGMVTLSAAITWHLSSRWMPPNDDPA